MSYHPTIALVFYLGVFLLASCGEETKITIETFITQYPDAFCAYHFKCCNSSQAERNFASLLSCKNYITQKTEEVLSFHDDEETPYVTFEASFAQSCLGKLQGADCSDASLVHGCLTKELTTAQQTEGEECHHNSECDSFSCVQEEKGATGACAEKGEGCAGDDRACDKGSFCKNQQCISKLESGKPCSESRECTSDVCSPSYKICVNPPKPQCDGK